MSRKRQRTESTKPSPGDSRSESSEETIQKAIRLPVETIEGLDRLSKLMGIKSKSEIVRMILYQQVPRYIKIEEQKKEDC